MSVPNADFVVTHVLANFKTKLPIMKSKTCSKTSLV